MPFMTRIPSDLARFGLRVELVPGWATRGSAAFAPACVVDHWTGGPRGTTGRPSLAVVTNGRPGLDGPLCNVYLARNGTCVVVAAGRANHAGAGGFRGLVGNSAAYGIEAESGGDGDWTPEMLDAYPRLNAALLAGLGRDASWVAGHCDWAPDRKIDIRDIIGAVRAKTAVALANPAAQEDDMFSDQDRALLRDVQERLRGDTSRGYDMLQSIESLAGSINTTLVGSHTDGNDRLTDLWTAILGQANPQAALDPAAIAAFIPKDIATQVADELTKRLSA